MPSHDGKALPKDRLSTIINDIRRRLGNLENQGPYIPVLTADPPVNTSNNIWMLSDGRLRVRLRDGTIVEYSPVATPGSSNSSKPAPITYPAQTQPKQITLTAALSASYDKSGNRVSGDTTLKYGAFDTSGPYKSLWAFDLTGLTFPTVYRAELFLHNQVTFNSGPMLLSLSTHAFNPHGQTSLPSIIPALGNSGVATPTFGPADPHWFDVDPTVVVPLLRTPSIYGFAIDQGLQFNMYGYASGVNDVGLPPQLRISYYA